MDFKVYEVPNNIIGAVYFLIDDDEIVYVGQTRGSMRRIMQHSNKKFNKYCFIETPEDELDYYEDLYMMKYQPKYNRRHNKYRISVNSSYYKLRNGIKNNMNKKQYKEYIISQNIKIEKFKNTETIKNFEHEILLKKLEEKYNIEH